MTQSLSKACLFASSCPPFYKVDAGSGLGFRMYGLGSRVAIRILQNMCRVIFCMTSLEVDQEALSTAQKKLT